jgi:glycosyltransferase involved in cell wall biosynthesis
MIRVLHFITGLKIGGAELSLHKLIMGSHHHRFQHRVISLLDEGALGMDIKGKGVPVYTLRMKNPVGIAAALPRMTGLVRTLQPDLLQGWMYHGNLAATLSHVLTGKKIPLLWNIRGNHTDLTIERPATSVVIRICGMLAGLPWGIVNNSLSSVAAHQARFGYPPNKWHIVPNGFDTTAFSPSALARERLRSELGIGADAIVIGHVGSFCLHRDHATVLQAMAELSRRSPGVHLVMIGRRVDDQNHVLVRWIQQLDLAEKVHLLGERRDIAGVTAAFDIATNSSIVEGFPNAVGEAMSCGVPCVVTDVGDSASLVGDTGRVIPPGDALALAQAWEALIAAGAEYRRALGARARERIITTFPIESCVGQYERLYEVAVSMHLQEEQGCAASQAS